MRRQSQWSQSGGGQGPRDGREPVPVSERSESSAHVAAVTNGGEGLACVWGGRCCVVGGFERACCPLPWGLHPPDAVALVRERVGTLSTRKGWAPPAVAARGQTMPLMPRGGLVLATAQWGVIHRKEGVKGG